jgi:hypothetical protein
VCSSDLQLIAQAFNLTNKANYGSNFGTSEAASIASGAQFGHPQGFMAPGNTTVPRSIWGELGAHFTF